MAAAKPTSRRVRRGLGAIRGGICREDATRRAGPVRPRPSPSPTMPKLNAINGGIGRELHLKPGGAVDRWIAEAAWRQHGVVARSQLVEAGIGLAAIDHRVRCGRLHVVHRAVYAVGHRVLSDEGRWLAAVLATGPGAVLSHCAAARCWELGRWDVLEVTARERTRGRPGIRLHYLPLEPDEITTTSGIPVTTLLRTLFDLAAGVSARTLARVVNEAEVRRLPDRLSLEDLLERYPRRHGAPAVRAVLADLAPGGTVSRSDLEARFREFVKVRRLPTPVFNAGLFVGGRWFECDCLWRAERLVVELDGRAAHGTSAAFELDRARDRMLHAAGWRVVRVTWRQLRREPEAIAADLSRILAGIRG